MNTTRLMIGGLLFLFTLLSGLWLSHLGRPLSIVLFTLHKLIALGTVILLGMGIYQLHRNAAGMGVPSLIATVTAGLLVLSMFISGALLSAGAPAGIGLLTVHRAAPLLAAISAVAAISLVAPGGAR